ncbi:Zinc finger protein 620 [Plecturocebus cupreus]
MHTTKKPFKCKECGKGLSSDAASIRHQRIHTGKLPSECKEGNSSVFPQHQRFHMGRNCECNKHWKTSSCSSSFIVHQQRTLGRNPMKLLHSLDSASVNSDWREPLCSTREFTLVRNLTSVKGVGAPQLVWKLHSASEATHTKGTHLGIGLSTGVTLLPKLECSGTISKARSPRLKRSSCISLSKMGFHHVAKAGFKLLDSSDPPASASQSAAGMTGMSHCVQPVLNLSHCISKEEPTIIFRNCGNEGRSWYHTDENLMKKDASKPGESQQRRHMGRQRDSFGQRGSFAGARCGASQCGVYGTDGLGWSHPHKENSNWKR